LTTKANVAATKAFQDKKGLKVDGQINPGGPTERALLGAHSEIASPYSRAPAGTPSIEQQTKTWAESQHRQQQAKQAPPSGYFSKNGVTFTDNWANDLIGGKAATATPKDGLLERTQDQKAADVGEQPMGPRTSPALTDTVGPNGKNKPSDVQALQEALVRNAVMNPNLVTGYIGTATQDATKAFQEQNNLKVDGIVNPGGPTETALMKDRYNVNLDGPSLKTPSTYEQMAQAIGQSYQNNLHTHHLAKPENIPLDQALDASAFALSFSPLIGDGVGLANDIRNYVAHPEMRTWDNYALSAVGLLPGVPSFAGMIKQAPKNLVDGAGKIVADFNPGDTRWGRGGKHLFGAKGTKLKGSHTIYNNTTNHPGYRFDVENRSPGKAPGQIHLQTPDKQKYIHNVNTKEWRPDVETTRALTRKEMDMLEKDEFQRALDKALKYMGEE